MYASCQAVATTVPTASLPRRFQESASLGLTPLEDVRNDIAQFPVPVGKRAGFCPLPAVRHAALVEAHCLRSS